MIIALCMCVHSVGTKSQANIDSVTTMGDRNGIKITLISDKNIHYL